MTNLLYVLTGLRQLILPDNCYLCKRHLRASSSQLCPACASLLKQCAPIFNSPSHSNLDEAWGAYKYEGPLTTLIHDFKYHGKTGLRHAFHQLLLCYLEAHHIPIKEFNIIMPIPLHPTRLRERGFNQAELLSKGLAVHFQLKHQPHWIKRLRPTESQTHLDQKQRFTNMREAFKINPSCDVQGKSILLVDDLLTTGATANAVAAILKGAKARRVALLTLAVT